MIRPGVLIAACLLSGTGAAQEPPIPAVEDTQVAGGRIDRTRAGVRLLTLYPMRLQ